MQALIPSAAVAIAMLAAAPVSAQPPVYRFPDVTTLVAPGSTIGVRVRELTTEEARGTATVGGGVYVEEVLTGTPADRAGLKPGDVVVEFDGERVRSVRSFTRLVSETPPQRTVKVIAVRDGSRRTIDISPVGANQLPDITARPVPNVPLLRPRQDRVPVPPQFGTPAYRGWIGITLQSVEGQMADYFGVKAGALVSAVDLDSPASRAGLKAGDVITGVAGQTVQRATDVSEAVRRTRPGSKLELKVVRDRKEITIVVDVPTGMKMLL